MNRSNRRRAWALVGATLCGSVALTGGLAASACSSTSPGGYDPFTDAGDLFEAGPLVLISSDAGTLKTWPPPGTAPCSIPDQCPGDPGANAVWVTISGESNALVGYPFPPDNFQADTYMVDGWEFQIDEYIVNVDDVVLWSNPNADPTNQGDLSRMTQVAHLAGPFVVDLHKGGRIIGQGGAPEEATPLGVILNQNDNGNAAFDSTTTYGFGFSTVPATYDAYNVNLDEGETADFALMVQKGYSVFYSGTATWKGGASPYGCTQTGDDGDAGYDFTRMPQTMSFKLGFATPTKYENCQNMSLQGIPNSGEDYPRGIQTSPSQSAIAQVTVHMDHPFWESFAENSPVHWDQIAAQYVGQSNPQVHVEDMAGVTFYAFTDATGTPLPWRNCSGSYYTPPGDGQMWFDTLSVPVNPQGVCTTASCPAIRDYYDYIRYSQSTQGHLNSQGLCFIDRQYPAPAGGS
jgi:hypothetical protein